ncbi:MAG: tRNA (adenosine(37)-N6)-threonylcarbamoyltransferase complex ATPase subunit type 1 TsaE [Burkholderiales bacterium]
MPAGGLTPTSLPLVHKTVWQSENETRAFAEALAGHAEIACAFIELRGDLGAGKTTFARHLLRELGVRGRIKSPTYTVVLPYEVALPQQFAQENKTLLGPSLAIWHFDFYRFTDAREWEDAGFREIFADEGLKLAEWPEKARSLLPLADLVIEIAWQADGAGAGDDQPGEARNVTLTAQTETGLKLLQ